VCVRACERVEWKLPFLEVARSVHAAVMGSSVAATLSTGCIIHSSKVIQTHIQIITTYTTCVSPRHVQLVASNTHVLLPFTICFCAASLYHFFLWFFPLPFVSVLLLFVISFCASYLCHFFLCCFSLPFLSVLLFVSGLCGSEAYMGHSVKNAVVTVPAYFNDSQRQVSHAVFT